MIEISDLKFSYFSHDGSENKILHNVNLTIRDGESVAMMGANGSGKTTLARCLNGLLLPTSGSVLIDGLDTKNPDHLRQIRRKVGMIFQNPENQIVSTTVEREIAFGLENLGIEHEKMHQIVEKMLSKFDLKQYRTHPPHLLSGGEMQRLAIASIMAMSPEVLVLDEPTSFLDPVHRNEVLVLVAGLKSNEHGQNPNSITTVFITQLPEEALFFKRLIILNHGRIYLDDSPLKIFEKVAALKKIGISVPLVFELNDYLKKISHGEFSLNTSDFLPIL